MSWVYPGDQLYMPSLYVYNRCHSHPFNAYIIFFISTNLLFLRKYSYFYLHVCDCHSSFRRISILYILSPRNRWYTWNLSLKTAYFGDVPTSRTLRKALKYDKKILFGHMFVAVLGRVVSRLLIPNSCHSRRILKAALEGRTRKQWGRKARLGLTRPCHEMGTGMNHLGLQSPELTNQTKSLVSMEIRTVSINSSHKHCPSLSFSFSLSFLITKKIGKTDWMQEKKKGWKQKKEM